MLNISSVIGLMLMKKNHVKIKPNLHGHERVDRQY